jgi:alpha 1,2-mannosyltransferase
MTLTVLAIQISSLSFWRSDAYRQFFEHIDRSLGIYHHRWGDAPIHLLAVASLLAESQVMPWPSLSPNFS